MVHRPKAIPDDPIFNFQAMVNAPGFPFKDFKDGKSAEEIFEALFSRFSNPPLLQLLQLNKTAFPSSEVPLHFGSCLVKDGLIRTSTASRRGLAVSG
jgi:hypothetical protein